jgi:hypothetical protein
VGVGLLRKVFAAPRAATRARPFSDRVRAVPMLGFLPFPVED